MSLQDAKLLLTPNAYKASKLYAIKPIDGTGDATVTRNTTKTRVNSLGLIESNASNVLAPDYLNGNCPALNVEGQATQRVGQSENLLGSLWLNFEAIITSAGSKIGLPFFKVENGGSPSTAAQNNISIPRVGNYNVSAFVDLDNFTSEYINLKLVTASVSFKVSDLSVTDNGSALIVDNSIKAENYGNNIYRLSFSFVATSTTDSSTLYLGATNLANGSTSTTSGEFGYFTGAQIAEGDEPTSYIPNSGTGIITRSADTVTVPIPAGVTEIIEKYEDGTTNTITTIPASPYTVPTGKRYEYILMR